MGRPAPLLEVARRFAEYTSGGRPVEHEPWSQGRHHRDGAVRYRLRRRLPSADRRSGRDRVQAGGGRRSVPCPSAAGGAPPAAAGVRRRHDAGRGASDPQLRPGYRDRVGGEAAARGRCWWTPTGRYASIGSRSAGPLSSPPGSESSSCRSGTSTPITGRCWPRRPGTRVPVCPPGSAPVCWRRCSTAATATAISAGSLFCRVLTGFVGEARTLCSPGGVRRIIVRLMERDVDAIQGAVRALDEQTRQLVADVTSRRARETYGVDRR